MGDTAARTSSEDVSEGLVNGEPTSNPAANRYIDWLSHLSIRETEISFQDFRDTYDDLYEAIRTAKADSKTSLEHKVEELENSICFEREREIDRLRHNTVESALVWHYASRYEHFESVFGIESPSRARLFAANTIIKQYQLKKRTAATQGKTIYFNNGREHSCEICGMSTRALIRIEELVEDVCDDSNIVICGRQRPKKLHGVPTKGWNMKPNNVKYKVYGILKKISWKRFGFRMPIIESIVKRSAYYIAQNKRKIPESDNRRGLDGKPNRRHGKRIARLNVQTDQWTLASTPFSMLADTEKPEKPAKPALVTRQPVLIKMSGTEGSREHPIIVESRSPSTERVGTSP